jgi:hypothetical protein
MTGGEFTPAYGVDYNVLPADANDKTVEWSVVGGSHLVSVDKNTGVVTASKATSNFVDGYARIRATSLAKDANGKSVGVYSEYIIEVIKAPADGEWSQSATNLPDGVTLSDYVIEYCASESDFNKGNWKIYDGEASKVYRYRFRDSYKLTWYYDLDSSDGNIELPSSLGYPKSANIGEKVTLSKLKSVTQTNKLFAGWFTSAEGARNLDKKLAYNGGAIKGDTEFFAGWIDLSSEEFLVNAAENDPIHPVGKNLQAFGERVAMNTPIQGAAADLIKIAMIRTDKMLREAGLKARLILQIHDELIIEAPIEEAERAEAILREAMQGAADLKVPLQVDVGTGKSWFDAKD